MARGSENRRRFIQGSLLAAAGASFPKRSLKGKASSDRPNVILITGDDLGWRELGCCGNPDIRTPNLDELAGQGVRFTNAFVTAPSCSASRASIITGQAPHSVGVHGLTHVHRQYQMSATIPTLPRALRDSGYRTAIQGKWHVAAFKPTGPYGYQHRLSLLKVKDSRKARLYISANRNHPFYLELNFIQPHRLPGGIYQMDPEFAVDPNSIHVPAYWCLPDCPEIREDAARYFSQISRMDKIIGEVLDHLDRVGLADRTLVVLLGDNGAPYPGCKTTCYDRGIGVPLILRWPEGLPRGKVIETIVSTIDLMPTCLAAAGAPAPESVQGTSLLPLARGEVTELHDAVFAEVTYHVFYTPMRAIRTREWKFIANLSPDPTGLDENVNFDWARRAAEQPGQRCCLPRPPEELFHLSEDPNEQINLADDPALAQTKTGLQKTLQQWRSATRDPFPGAGR